MSTPSPNTLPDTQHHHGSSIVSVVTDQAFVCKEQIRLERRGQKTDTRRKKVKSQGGNAILTLGVVVGAFVGNLRYYYNGYSEDELTDFTRIAVWVFSLLQVVLIFSNFHVARTSAHASTHPPNLAVLGIEIVVHLLALPPRVNALYSFPQLGTSAFLSLSDVFFLLAVLRLYHIPVLGYLASPYTSLKALVHCDIQGVENSVTWVARCTIQKLSIASLLGVWVLLALAFGLCINVSEHGAVLSTAHNPWDSVWLTVVSQSSVGYGDFFLRTHLGRLLTCLDILSGLLVLALVVKKSSECLQLTRKQGQLYRAVGHRKGMTGVMSDLGSRLIQKWWLLVLARKRGESRLQLVVSLVRAAHTFKLHLKKLQALEDPSLEDELSLFERHSKRRLQQVSSIFWELDEMNHKVRGSQAYDLMNKEYAILKKVRSAVKWLKKKVGRKRRSVRLSLASRGSGSSRGTIVQKLAQRKAREFAMRKLTKRIQSEFGSKFLISSGLPSEDSLISVARDISSGTGQDWTESG